MLKSMCCCFEAWALFRLFCPLYAPLKVLGASYLLPAPGDVRDQTQGKCVSHYL